MDEIGVTLIAVGFPAVSENEKNIVKYKILGMNIAERELVFKYKNL